MRSWTAEVTAFGVVVRIEQDLTHGIRHLRSLNASRSAAFLAAVSDLALIILAAPDGSFAHQGMSNQGVCPHLRISISNFNLCRRLSKLTSTRLSGKDSATLVGDTSRVT